MYVRLKLISVLFREHIKKTAAKIPIVGVPGLSVKI